MSTEGVALVMRAALVLFLIITAAIFRASLGPGKKRGNMMLAGTVGGISIGVLMGYPISQWLDADASVLCACFGMVLGWGATWLYARGIPQQAD